MYVFHIFHFFKFLPNTDYPVPITKYQVPTTKDPFFPATPFQFAGPLQLKSKY